MKTRQCAALHNSALQIDEQPRSSLNADEQPHSFLIVDEQPHSYLNADEQPHSSTPTQLFFDNRTARNLNADEQPHSEFAWEDSVGKRVPVRRVQPRTSCVGAQKTNEEGVLANEPETKIKKNCVLSSVGSRRVSTMNSRVCIVCILFLLMLELVPPWHPESSCIACDDSRSAEHLSTCDLNCVECTWWRNRSKWTKRCVIDKERGSWITPVVRQHKDGTSLFSLGCSVCLKARKNTRYGMCTVGPPMPGETIESDRAVMIQGFLRHQRRQGHTDALREMGVQTTSDTIKAPNVHEFKLVLSETRKGAAAHKTGNKGGRAAE